MTDEKQEGQKTVVSFIVGLLIGGLLVWAFSGPSVEAPKKDENKDAPKSEEVKTENEDGSDVSAESTSTEASAPVLNVGEGKVTIGDQTAGNFISLASATYPVAEGWIGVRDYSDGRLGGLLGVARFSEEQGLVPTGVPLQRATVSGREYAVVVYTESGDREFNLAEDKQLDSVFATFTAK